MDTHKIAALLGTGTTPESIDLIINPYDTIKNLKTAAEAIALFGSCTTESMRQALTKKFKKLVQQETPKLTKAADAKRLWNISPNTMLPEVLAKWEDLVRQEIELLITLDEARDLFDHCPSTMLSALICKWTELVNLLVNTPIEAAKLFDCYPALMKPAVLDRWIAITIPFIIQIEEAVTLYNGCPLKMKPKVVKKWEELVQQKTLTLKTPAEAQKLFKSCITDKMKSVVVKKWEEIVRLEIPSYTTVAEVESLLELGHCPSSMRSTVIARWGELAIPLLTTPAKAQELFIKLKTKEMQSMVAKKWEDIVRQAILELKRPEEAKVLFNQCPESMRPAVTNKWEDIVRQAILKLKRPEEAKVLFNQCPASMHPEVIKWLSDYKD
jgi:hypothetical protein